MNNKILIIVESPTKAKKIKEYLSDDYIITFTKGHILTLAKGKHHGIGIDIKNNFKPKFILSDDRVDVFDNIINLAKKCKEILIFSDPDVEGEAIAYHLKDRLQDLNIPIRRGIFNEVKKSKILKAIEEAGDVSENKYHSFLGRRLLDRITGFSASPFLINCFNQKLSAGRVQSVVTKMVIDREKEIKDFIPEDYWIIQIKLSKNDNVFISKYYGKISNKEDADNILKKLTHKNYVVSSVISNEEKNNSPAPLITSTLQQIMSKKYFLDAKKTLECAAELFASGYITYPRTDSKRSSDESIQELREWLSQNNYLIPKKPNIYKNSDNAQDAHECIRPTDITFLPTLNDNYLITDPNQKIVYEIIWKYFVASQMNPAIYNTLKVISHPENDSSVKVISSGKSLKSKGFLEILEIIDDSKIDIPELIINDNIKLFENPKLEKKETQPPSRWNEANLLKYLSDKGIGRPSTYADLLSKITSRNYVEKKNNVYYATELGYQITEKLKKHFTFLEYDYTAKLEKQLDLIEEGKLNYIDMLKDFYTKFKKELDIAYKMNGNELCEKCNNPLIVRKNKKLNSEFLGCSAYPRCMFVKQFN